MFLLLTVVISLGQSVGKYKADVYLILIKLIYNTDITVHPESRNTTLNSSINFICEANILDITFLVNGTLAIAADIVNRGFIQQGVEDLGSGKWRRVLLVKASEDNNNTNISCRVISTQTVYSDIAVLRIQGKLDHYYILNWSIISL